MLKLEIRNFSKIHENIKMNSKCAFESDIEKVQPTQFYRIFNSCAQVEACQKI